MMVLGMNNYLFTNLFIATNFACNNQGFITYKAIHLDYIAVV
jgi:hypothetical protein